MTQPAAPYHEHHVREAVEGICAEHDLKARRDAHGNVLVTLATGRTRPLVLAAHMDHPGFARLHWQQKRCRAEFLGGVPDNYFHQGTKLRLFPGNHPAQLGRRLGVKKRFELLAPLEARETAAFGVWDLESFAVRQKRIHGRSCDDLIGVASILATLVQLKQSRIRCHVMGVISRAEEVGFQGALMAAASRAIPRRALVVSLETSRELPPVQMGQGVIVRVGDRSSVFDSTATRFLTEVAQGEVKRTALSRTPFKFQRALMSGGTCEGTAYQEAGFQTAAVCVALGNYHNCGAEGTIRPEFVSVTDAEQMVQLLVAAARAMPVYDEIVGRLTGSLRNLSATARREL